MTNRRRRQSSAKSKPANNRNRSRKSKSKAQRSFWGDAELANRVEEPIKIAEDPAAVVRSLGSPPLSGHETVAEHYFDAVYERAVGLASALAAAANLLEDDLDPTGGLERQ